MTNEELANDRTFLAWLRTSIAVIGLGFVVAKASRIVQPTAKGNSNLGLYAAVGIVIVLCGGVLMVTGYIQHKTVLDHLRAGEETPRPRWTLTITAAVVAGSFLLSALIGVST